MLAKIGHLYYSLHFATLGHSASFWLPAASIGRFRHLLAQPYGRLTRSFNKGSLVVATDKEWISFLFVMSCSHQSFDYLLKGDSLPFLPLLFSQEDATILPFFLISSFDAHQENVFLNHMQTQQFKHNFLDLSLPSFRNRSKSSQGKCLANPQWTRSGSYQVHSALG